MLEDRRLDEPDRTDSRLLEGSPVDGDSHDNLEMRKISPSSTRSSTRTTR